MTRRTPRRVAALLAALALATASAVVSAGPANAGEDGSHRAESGQHVDGIAESTNSHAAVADCDPITVDDLRSLVAQFEATGEVTFAGARRMETALVLAEMSISRATPALAIRSLEIFKQVAATPRYVPSTAASEELIAAADQLIATL